MCLLFCSNHIEGSRYLLNLIRERTTFELRDEVIGPCAIGHFPFLRECYVATYSGNW
jgi:hypothetical protein